MIYIYKIVKNLQLLHTPNILNLYFKHGTVRNTVV